jgi:hypothetical protein
MQLTDKLYYNGLTFYHVGNTSDNDRIYESLDELIHYTITTAPADYDGVLIAVVDESFRESENDDMIRYFDSETGKEETIDDITVIEKLESELTERFNSCTNKELVLFSYNGISITNPFLSECMRYAVYPRYYGVDNINKAIAALS